MVTITKELKYQILDDYLYSNITNETIAIKYGIDKDKVNYIIKNLYKDFQVTSETKALVAETGNITTWKQIYDNVLDSDKINKEFLNELSDPNDLCLTDKELIFCELYNSDNDIIKALEESRLNVGLDKASKQSVYNRALELRGFYLKRKPNIAAYIQKIQRERLGLITEGKEYVQTQLVNIIHQLRDRQDDKSIQTQLKALESLGKTFDAFSTTVKFEDITGDNALDKILEKAKKAQVLSEKYIEQ